MTEPVPREEDASSSPASPKASVDPPSRAYCDAPEPQGFSTLEVASSDNHQEELEVVASENAAVLPQALHPNALPQTQYVPPGYQAYYDHQSNHMPGTTYYHTSLVSSPHSPQAESQYADKEKGEEQRKRLCGLAPKTFWIIAVLLTFGVTAAIVGGAVGGVLAARHGNEAAAANKNDTAAGPGSVTPRKLLANSQLTTTNWTDGDTAHYAVFAQDPNNALMVSMWDSKGRTWGAFNVSSAIAAAGTPIDPKPGTPLTAYARAPSQGGFELHATFLSQSNVITDIMTDDMAGKTWALGDLMQKPPKTADSNSSLASVWHICNTGPDCNGAVLIAYQIGGNLMLLNSSTGWIPEQTSGKVPIYSGSSLNMFMVGGSELRLNYHDPDQILIDFKRVAAGKWEEGFLPGGLLPTPGNLQYAGSSYENFNKTFVAATNVDGSLTAYIWDHERWTANQPLTLADTPQNANKTFTAVAQHSEQRIYVIGGDDILEYHWDTLYPTLLNYIGDVPMKPAS